MPRMLHRQQQGQIIVFIAIIMVVLMLLLALVIEWGVLFRVRQELQQWCDASSLAGAQDLPNASQARTSATGYYARNLELDPGSAQFIGQDDDTYRYRIGNDEVSVTTPYENERTRSLGLAPEVVIRVDANREVSLLFGSLLGVDSSIVQAFAIGAKAPGIGALLFNNSQTTPLTITGNATVIDGDAHTNQDLVIAGSNHAATGRTTVVGRSIIGGSNHRFNVQPSPVQPRPELPVPLSTYRARADRLIIGSDYRRTRAQGVEQGITFVEGGDIYIDVFGANARVTLIAVRQNGRGGRVQITGSSWTLNSTDNVLFVYGETGVRLHGYNNAFFGVIYSTGSHVRISGGGFQARSVIVGEGITIGGSVNRISPGPTIYPGQGVALVE